MISTSTHKRGFSLVEVLVVIAVIAILGAILIPTVQSVRERSATASSVSNLRQLGAAMSLFSTDNDGAFPPAIAQIKDADGNWAFLGSWDGFILPYMGIDVPKNHPNPQGNADRIAGLASVFSHPNDTSEIDPNIGSGLRRSYAMPTATGSIGVVTWSGTEKKFSERQYSIFEPTRTLLLVERGGVANNVVGRTGFAGVNEAADQREFQSELNPDGRFNYLFADGHVGTYSVEETIGPNGTLEAPEGFWTINPTD